MFVVAYEKQWVERIYTDQRSLGPLVKKYSRAGAGIAYTVVAPPGGDVAK